MQDMSSLSPMQLGEETMSQQMEEMAGRQEEVAEGLGEMSEDGRQESDPPGDLAGMAEEAQQLAEALAGAVWIRRCSGVKSGCSTASLMRDAAWNATRSRKNERPRCPARSLAKRQGRSRPRILTQCASSCGRVCSSGLVPGPAGACSALF